MKEFMKLTKDQKKEVAEALIQLFINSKWGLMALFGIIILGGYIEHLL